MEVLIFGIEALALHERVETERVAKILLTLQIVVERLVIFILGMNVRRSTTIIEEVLPVSSETLHRLGAESYHDGLALCFCPLTKI